MGKWFGESGLDPKYLFAKSVTGFWNSGNAVAGTGSVMRLGMLFIMGQR